MSRSAMGVCRAGLLAVAALAWACGGEGGGGGSETCEVQADCAPGEACVSGRCVVREGGVPDAARDAGTDATTGCACGAGEVCRPGGRCEADCANPEAEPCPGGQVCDVLTARCVPEGSEGVLIGEGERCGDGGPLCLPGTACDVAGERCVSQPPCYSMRCTEDGRTCWGTGCQRSRPEPPCVPAPLERLNEPDFLLSSTRGYEGIDDLEFDEICNAYASTMISGPDYLRQLEPDGTLTTWQSVSNLNMGEVAVLRPLGGEFGGGGPGEVAATYICCSSCGCRAGEYQGVIRLVREDPDTPLPLVLPATVTDGSGPFGSIHMDTGPAGLLWGPDRSLYVGNVEGNGDLVRVDLATGTHRTLVTFEQRIFTTERFDRDSILVALEGGRVVRLDVDSGAWVPWAELGAEVDVASLVRDPLLGVVYAAVRRVPEGGAPSWQVLRLAADGSVLGPLEGVTLRGPSRLSYAPDGKLYVLYLGDWPARVPPAVEAHALPMDYRAP